jgi:flagellar hook-associated protein 1 FlgK
MDQRDQALKELSNYISFQTYEQSFGEVNVLIASGQNLIVGSQARSIDVVQSEADPTKLEVVFVDDTTSQPIANAAVGGEIGGVFRFRDEVLEDTYNKIGRIAVVLADTYNQVHQQGLDLNNNFGGSFFFDVNETQIARNRVIANSNNEPPNDRVMRLNIEDSAALTTSDYEVTMINDGLFSVRRLSDDVEVAREVLSGAYPASTQFDGLELVFESGSFQRGDSFMLEPTKAGARDFRSALVNPEELAFASPLVTDASLSNQGNAEISAGQILGLTDPDGVALPMFATPGQMSPPLAVRFISNTTYEILDNSDPGNPVALSPPISNRVYVPGVENELFGSDPGETIAFMSGSPIGLPAGSVPVVGGGTLTNGYPSETITLTRASTIPGALPLVDTIAIAADASARTIASQLDNIAGVSANASTYAEISSTSTLTRSSPLQININGQDLVEYEFDSGAGAFVVASSVPDPSTDEAAFNDYLADRINSDSALQALGIFAVAAVDPNTGAEELRIHSSQGDDLQISLEADATGPDSLNVSDGSNPAIALDGNGAGTTSAIAVGGTLEVTMAEGVTLASATVSGLFGDTSATGFAQSTYLGIQASIRGTPQSGDIFELNFNLDAANDNRNALAMVQLDATGTVGNGVASYTESYASVVEIIGINTASSQINRDAAEQVLQQSEELRNSISGVNLDEEAADLIRFEQMYSANAQVISVARDLFDRLINSF